MDIDLDEPSDTGFDIGSSMDKVADSLGLRGASGVLPTADHSEAGAVPSDADAASDTEDTDSDVSDDDSSSTDPEAASLDSPASRPAPKSWTKDRHEMWAKLPPEAQDYYEFREKQFLDGLEQYKGEASYGKAMKDVLSPYKPILAAQGIDEAQAVQYLMNAHYKLTQGTTEQRMAAYHKLGQDLRLTGEAPAASEVAPEIRQLQEKLSGIESSLTARQQAEANAARERAAKEVSDFASDKANPYFDEVAGLNHGYDVVCHFIRRATRSRTHTKRLYGLILSHARKRLHGFRQKPLQSSKWRQVRKPKQRSGHRPLT